MLDVNIIRNNPDMIREMLRNRNKDETILDTFLEADSEWRSLTDENNRLRKVRNEVSLQISKMPKGEEKDANGGRGRKIYAEIVIHQPLPGQGDARIISISRQER